MKYRRLKGTNDGGPICANAPDAFTLKSASKITLQPGEEKEEVLIYLKKISGLNSIHIVMIRI